MSQKISDRIKLVRESQKTNGKKISQEAFANLLGVTRSVIKNLEYDKVEPQKPILTSICTMFDINYDWLTTGKGEMHKKPEYFSLDKYAADHHLTALELDIVREYMSMDEDTRKVIMDKIMSVAKRHIEAETAATLADNGIDIDAEVENYRRELESEKTSPTSQALPNTNIAG